MTDPFSHKTEPSILKNHSAILKTEPSILKNQSAILKNEPAILVNDAPILKNDASILKTECSSLKNEKVILLGFILAERWDGEKSHRQIAPTCPDLAPECDGHCAGRG